MAIVLFDNAQRKNLYPLSATKAIAALRTGILSIEERWALVTGEDVYIHTEKYLQPLYRPIKEGDNIWVDAGIMITPDLWKKISFLQSGEALTDQLGLVAGRSRNVSESFESNNSLAWFTTKIEIENRRRLEFAQQLFQWNDELLRSDFDLVTKDKTSELISSTNQTIQPENIFIEQGASIELCTLNAATGPIYIGKGATIMEGSVIRGPFALGENALLKMGSKIYGATSLGPNCVGGGEIKNVVMQGNSNKAHDGYLGDSVIGEWCNFGAGSSNSNVKNTGGNVQLWNHGLDKAINAGQKCGVIMGDYTRVAINSSINTGSVFGVCCNVFGVGLLPKKLDNFSWGITETYRFEKALLDIQNWKKMKHQQLSSAETDMLKHIFENN